MLNAYMGLEVQLMVEQLPGAHKTLHYKRCVCVCPCPAPPVPDSESVVGCYILLRTYELPEHSLKVF